jgi:hypothetical protein
MKTYPAEDRYRDYECPETELDRVYHALRPYLGRFCLAGGCVRDRLAYLKPKDHDAFCFDPPDFAALAKRFDLAVTQHRYRDMACLTVLWQRRRLQVIYRRGIETIPRLLETFDWACCCWAWDGVAIRGLEGVSQRIEPGAVLRLNAPSIANPDNSLRRGRRFAERFQMSIDPADERRLRSMIWRSGRLRTLRRIGGSLAA